MQLWTSIIERIVAMLEAEAPEKLSKNQQFEKVTLPKMMVAVPRLAVLEVKVQLSMMVITVN